MSLSAKEYAAPRKKKHYRWITYVHKLVLLLIIELFTVLYDGFNGDQHVRLALCIIIYISIRRSKERRKKSGGK